VEPGDLATALIELRSLRAMVQKQRKRIWFLENKDSVTAKQRQRRRDVHAQDAAAALANLAKEPRKTK
jgi:hypothetical protein